MRTVSIDISKLRLNVGDKITIQLINSIGDLATTIDGYSLDEEITLDSVFSKELMPTQDIDFISTYKLIFPNASYINFIVPSTNTTAHDLLSLFKMPCTDGVINKDNSLSNSFIAKLDLYLIGESPNFNANELNIVKLYEYFADEIISDTTKTIDIMEVMDKYLTTIGV